MSWFANLRLLAFARRITRAIESIADSLRTLARISADEWAKENAPRPPRKMEFGSFDVEEANKRYRKEREAQGISEEDES